LGEGGVFRASKKAALLRTELGLIFCLSHVPGCGSDIELLVLQLLPDCWRSDAIVASADTVSVLESAWSAEQKLVCCSSADSSM